MASLSRPRAAPSTGIFGCENATHEGFKGTTHAPPRGLAGVSATSKDSDGDMNLFSEPPASIPAFADERSRISGIDPSEGAGAAHGASATARSFGIDPIETRQDLFGATAAPPDADEQMRALGEAFRKVVEKLAASAGSAARSSASCSNCNGKCTTLFGPCTRCAASTTGPTASAPGPATIFRGRLFSHQGTPLVPSVPRLKRPVRHFCRLFTFRVRLHISGLISRCTRCAA